jgi:hypothetical protein
MLAFGSGGRSALGIEEAAARGAQPPEKVEEMIALGDAPTQERFYSGNFAEVFSLRAGRPTSRARA